MPAGKVYVFNPTSSDYNIYVNGQTRTSLPGTTTSAGWIPGTTTNPFARNALGNPADTEFGWHNRIRISLTSGKGEDAQFELDIPTSIQNSNDLQMYVYYSGDFQTATYTVMNQGAIFAEGGLVQAVPDGGEQAAPQP